MLFCLLRRASLIAALCVLGCGDIDKRNENVNAGFAEQFQIGSVQSDSNVEVSVETKTGDSPENFTE